MAKFKKGNVHAFKPTHVPHNKGVRMHKTENLPALYIRLPKKMDQMVQNPVSASNSKEMTQ